MSEVVAHFVLTVGVMAELPMSPQSIAIIVIGNACIWLASLKARSKA